MPDINQIIQDPNFKGLAPEEQHKVLMKVDPNYGQLPPEEQQKVISKLPSVQPQQESSWKDRAIDFVRPIAADAGFAGGTLLGSELGPAAPLVGMAGYGLVDRLLQHLKSQPEQGLLSQTTGATPGSFSSDTLNSLEQAGLGKILGPVVGKVGKTIAGGVKEFNNPNSVVKDIYGLNPTWSQTVKEGSVPQSIGKFIENTFGSSDKAKAVANSAQSGYNKFIDYAQTLSGRSKSVLENPEEYANKISLEGARNQFDALNNGMDSETGKLKLFGNMNQNPVVKGFDNLGQQVTENRPGPIHLVNVRNEIDQFEQSLQGKALTEPDKRVLATIDKIKQSYDPATFDDPNPANSSVQIVNGRPAIVPAKITTGNRPISLNDAMDYRKVLDGLSTSPNTRKLLTTGDQASDFFGKLKNALDDDLEFSFSKWASKGTEAKQAFDNLRFLEDAKKEVFEKSGLSELLSNPDIKQSSYINNILKDPAKIDRAFQAGSVTLPNGTKLASSNIRNDLSGYRLSQILQDNVERDAKGQLTRLNVKGMRDAFNDPSFMEQNKKLFSKATRDSINDFLGALGRTQENISTGPNKVWMMRRGIEIGSGFLLGHGLTGFGAGVIGAELSGMGLAKVMNNPKYARIMIAAAKGEPLGMSQQLAAKYITEALQGLTMNVIDANGKEHKATVTSNGLQPENQ